MEFCPVFSAARGREATEVWVPDQTSGAQAPFFGGLLGLSARSALRATPPQFALRARGRCPLPVGPSLPGRVSLFPKTKVLLNFFQKIAGSKGSEATEVWVPDQTSGAQAPFFGGLLGLSARSALRATPPQFALRARGRCPLPVGPSLPGRVPLFPKTKVLLNFFQKIAGSRGGAPDALRTASRSEAFRAQPAEGRLLARDERGTPYPVKRVFRVNCREAVRGFLQVKKPPCIHKISNRFLCGCCQLENRQF